MSTSAKVRIGLVGAGAMGSQHARLLGASPVAMLAAVVDVDSAAAAALAAPHGAPHATDVDPTGWDAAIVASPTETHVDVVRSLLEAGVPVLVEKPLSQDLDGATALITASENADVPLQCGFVERFNPVVLTLIDLLDEPPLHVVTVRHSPRAPRIATSVVHDLLIHDIDLAARLMPGPLHDVVACGWRSDDTGTFEIADATIRFDGAVATLSSDRWGQRKVRTLSVSTASNLIELDLLRQDVTVYRHVRHEVAADASYRAETVIDIPFVRQRGEPLALQLEHFVGLVRGEIDPGPERDSLLRPHEIAARVEASLMAADQ